MADDDKANPGLESAIARARPEASVAADTALRKVRRALFGVDTGAPQVGRFLILSQLGSGAMGDVFEAYDPKLDRKVALKIVRGKGAATARRLLREARALARLSHPNVVSVHEAEADDDRLYIAMELVRGQDLRCWLESNRSQRQIARVLAEAARGLQAAHEAGLTHGDFKPENVLVGDDGRVRVADFGLARLGEQAERGDAEGDLAAGGLDTATASLAKGSVGSTATRSGAAGGTPAYMAPEVTDGAAATPRSDQYSFCVSLCEALTGERPVAQKRSALALHKGLIRVAERGLAADPAQRFADLTPVIAALDKLVHRTRRGVVTFAGGALVVLGVGLAFALARSGEVDRAAQCRAGADIIETVWSQKTRAQLAEHWKLDPAVAGEVGNRLDRYRDKWTSAYREVCDATHSRGEQSMELLDRKMDCLGSRKKELVALVELWLASDARSGLARAVSAAGRLIDVDECMESWRLGIKAKPADPELRREVDAIDDLLARTRALSSQGQVAEAEELGRQTVTRAEALDFAPILARALYEHGYILRDLSSPRALDTMRRAMTVAGEAGDRARAADMGLQVLHVLIEDRNYDGADAIVPHVRAAIEETRDPRHSRAFLDLQLGKLALRRGKPEEAEKLLRDAARALETVEDPSRWIVLNELGTVLSAQGRYEEAVTVLKEAVVVGEQAAGKDHPQVGHALHELGAALKSLARFDEARPVIERALQIALAGHKQDTTLVVALRNNLGGLERLTGNYDAALRHFQSALDAELGRDKPDPYRKYLLTYQVGNTHQSAGRYIEAIEIFDRAASGIEKTYGEIELLSSVLDARAEARRKLGQLDAALADVERAIAITVKHKGKSHPALLLSLLKQGAIHRTLGDHRAARDACQRGIDVAVPSLGEKHPDLMYAYGCVALANLGLGALPAAEQAASLLELDKSGDPWPALGLFVQAEARWKRGLRCDAIATATRARSLLDANDLEEDDLAILAKPWPERAGATRCAQ